MAGILLIGLICLFAVIIYTPLHTHRNGRCSFNNVESYQTESIIAAIPIPVLEYAGILELTPAFIAAPALSVPTLPSRAPPALAA